MLNKLLNIFTKNKKNIILLSFMIIGFFYLGDTTFAADSSLMTVDQETTEKVAEVIRWIGSTITVFLSLLTYLAVMFLSPEWINGSLFGLNGYFKQIWILVSNVVYFVFAFILIWIAFMNIIGKGQDKYQLKQALPKFFIGIMIVPLSWFLVNFILSISSILTISAINLPYDTFPGFNSKITEVEIPKDCTINLSKESGKSGTGEGESGTGSTNTFFSCDKDSGKVMVGTLMESTDSSSKIFSVLGTYAYGVIGLENIDQLNNFDQEKIKTILDLVVKLVFDVLFIIVYAVLMIALALVLMTRGIYIWIYMMISPLFGLMYFFDKSSGGGEFFDKFNIKQFISLAMVPVYTMLALTFGLLFIFVVAEGMAAGNTSQSLNGLQSINLDDGKLTIGSGENAFSLNIEGAAANEENISNIWQTAVSESNGVLGVIGTLIMKIFGIVVLWGAVMAALRTNEVTKAVVEPLHAFGTQVGQLATKSPQYAPIFGGQSMKSLEQVGQKAHGYMNTRTTDRSTELWNKFGLENNYSSTMQRNIDTASRATHGSEVSSSIDNAFKNMDGKVERLQSNEFKRLLDSIADNNASFINDDFREYMSELSGKDSLSNHEIAEALKKLENSQVDLSINGRAIDGAGLTGAVLANYVIDGSSVDSGDNESINNSQNQGDNQDGENNVDREPRVVNINLTDNGMRQIDLSGVEGVDEITDSDIRAISSIDDINGMTKEEFSEILRNNEVANNKINPIIEYLEREGINFSDSNENE